MRPLVKGSISVLALAWACTSPSIPGELLGRFSLRATPISRNCQLTEKNNGDGGPEPEPELEFEATLSADADAPKAYLTLSGVSREATFDGQVFTSTGQANRVFTECGGCTSTVLEETLELALLSPSQARALDGGQCPPNPLDGGVPAPNPDAGIVGPARTEMGFDAVLACGTLHSELKAVAKDDAGSCPDICRVCTKDFEVTGSRR